MEPRVPIVRHGMVIRAVWHRCRWRGSDAGSSHNLWCLDSIHGVWVVCPPERRQVRHSPVPHLKMEISAARARDDRLGSQIVYLFLH